MSNSNEIDVSAISRYMYAAPDRRWITVIVFAVCALFLISTGVSIPLCLAAAALMAGGGAALLHRHEGECAPPAGRLLRADKLEELVEDFRTGKEISGVGRFGKKYFVGCNTTIIVDYAGVSKVDLHVRRFNREEDYYLAFFIMGNEPVNIIRLAGPRDMRCRDQIRQALQGVVPLGSAFDKT